jgi:hypothetical protein
MPVAFSNGTEWDEWARGWCFRCEVYDTCPILTKLFIDGPNEVPPEWTPGPHVLGPSRYQCTVFTPNRDGELDALEGDPDAERLYDADGEL